MNPTITAIVAAVNTGNYPPGTTAHYLTQLRSAAFWSDASALHDAAETGYLPPGTTADDLANCKNDDGWSALHAAAIRGHLPTNTNAAILHETKTKQGLSAWFYLCRYAKEHPTKATELPHTLFANNPDDAIDIVNTICQNPTLRRSATIWLGHVLAASKANVQTTCNQQPRN